eukprot:8950738-Pyramimonas_sp.AAC.1
MENKDEETPSTRIRKAENEGVEKQTATTANPNKKAKTVDALVVEVNPASSEPGADIQEAGSMKSFAEQTPCTRLLLNTPTTNKFNTHLMAQEIISRTMLVFRGLHFDGQEKISTAHMTVLLKHIIDCRTKVHVVWNRYFFWKFHGNNETRTIQPQFQLSPLTCAHVSCKHLSNSTTQLAFIVLSPVARSGKLNLRNYKFTNSK